MEVFGILQIAAIFTLRKHSGSPAAQHWPHSVIQPGQEAALEEISKTAELLHLFVRPSGGFCMEQIFQRQLQDTEPQQGAQAVPPHAGPQPPFPAGCTHPASMGCIASSAGLEGLTCCPPCVGMLLASGSCRALLHCCSAAAGQLAHQALEPWVFGPLHTTTCKCEWQNLTRWVSWKVSIGCGHVSRTCSYFLVAPIQQPAHRKRACVFSLCCNNREKFPSVSYSSVPHPRGVTTDLQLILLGCKKVQNGPVVTSAVQDSPEILIGSYSPQPPQSPYHYHLQSLFQFASTCFY